ncbi:MAG TPA: ABC transporter permease [Mobilitalea sp.]|nr:ABC transporter permease [Mobilitalea sp.]
MISYILFKVKKYKVMLPSIIITSLLTLLFIYVFGVGFGESNPPSLMIVDEDHTSTSTAITEQLKENKGYSFQDKELEDAKESLENKEIIGIIYFEKGFEEGLTTNSSHVTLYKTGVDVEVINLENSLKQYVTEAILDERFPRDAAKLFEIEDATVRNQFEDNRSEYVTYSVDSVYYGKDTDNFNMFKHSFAGFILFFSMFTIMSGIGSIVEEKELHVWQRQMVSPLSTATILVSDLISNFIVSMSQMTIVVLLSRFLFHIEWGGSTLAIILILGAYIFAATALGLLISTLVRTQQQLGAIVPLVIVSTSMIGGTMWPREIMNNAILLKISDFLPQRWAMKGLLDVIMYSKGLADVVQPLIYLMIITVVLIAASIRFYRKVI